MKGKMNHLRQRALDCDFARVGHSRREVALCHAIGPCHSRPSQAYNFLSNRQSRVVSRRSNRHEMENENENDVGEEGMTKTTKTSLREERN